MLTAVMLAWAGVSLIAVALVAVIVARGPVVVLDPTLVRQRDEAREAAQRHWDELQRVRAMMAESRDDLELPPGATWHGEGLALRPAALEILADEERGRC